MSLGLDPNTDASDFYPEVLLDVLYLNPATLTIICEITPMKTLGNDSEAFY